jgi:uncharacterized damage-inducible protein DinB
MSRGRDYSFKPRAGFKDSQVATAAAMLVEAAERICDVLSYADEEMLHFIPAGSYLSVARLVKHLAWAEMGWVGRLCGVTPPKDLVDLIGDPSAGRLPDMTEGEETTEELCAGIRRLQSSFSLPALAGIDDIDSPFEAAKGPNTVRQVLSHLIWHWTYHSGQVGITLLQAGHDYEWAFARNEE